MVYLSPSFLNKKTHHDQQENITLKAQQLTAMLNFHNL